jgi:hypothetical protein
MKIVGKQEFLKLPEYTLFNKLKSMSIEDLRIKRETIDTDFMALSLNNLVDCVDSADYCKQLEKAKLGKPLKIDFDNYFRDGLYEDVHFIIWENKDILQLISLLQKCVNIKKQANET